MINRTNCGNVKYSFVEMYKEKLFEDTLHDFLGFSPLSRDPLADASTYTGDTYDGLTDGYTGGTLFSPFM